MHKFLARMKAGLIGLLVWAALAVLWTGLLYATRSWQPARTLDWPSHLPVAVSHRGDADTRVVTYREWVEAQRGDPSLRAGPATAAGQRRVGRDRAGWTSVSGALWSYEVVLETPDTVLESRYRLDGDVPVLVASRQRDAGLAFQGIALAFATVLAWKVIARLVRRRAIT